MLFAKWKRSQASASSNWGVQSNTFKIEKYGKLRQKEVRKSKMPLYEYECTNCHRRTEKRQKFSDPELTDCPFCGALLERVISAPAVMFKGGGWYADLYSSKGGTKAPAASGDSAPSSDTSAASTTTSTESKPAAAAPATATTAAPSTSSSSDKK
jgi:putative FmdB family regulatory protein